MLFSLWVYMLYAVSGWLLLFGINLNVIMSYHTLELNMYECGQCAVYTLH